MTDVVIDLSPLQSLLALDEVVTVFLTWLTAATRPALLSVNQYIRRRIIAHSIDFSLGNRSTAIRLISIEECPRNVNLTLDCRGRPDFGLQLPQLRSLTLMELNLQNFNLDNLWSLCVHECRSTKLIRQLTNLTELELVEDKDSGGLDFTHLRLTKLICYSRKLLYPSTLRHLEISMDPANHAKHFQDPHCLSHLTNLTELKLISYYWCGYPVSIPRASGLTKLTALEIDFTLPPDKVFDLRHFRTTIHPDLNNPNLYQLRDLECPCEIISDNYLWLSTLTRLKASLLGAITVDLNRYTNLQVLDMNMSSKIQYYPSTVTRLISFQYVPTTDCLRDLEVRAMMACQITNLLELTNLTRLKICGTNWCIHLPNLPSLTDLEIEYGGQYPEPDISYFSLTNLTKLKLHHRDDTLLSSPNYAEMIKLTKLEDIDINWWWDQPLTDCLSKHTDLRRLAVPNFIADVDLSAWTTLVNLECIRTRDSGSTYTENIYRLPEFLLLTMGKL